MLSVGTRCQVLYGGIPTHHNGNMPFSYLELSLTVLFDWDWNLNFLL